MKDFLEMLECYALVRLLLTQEPHIAELNRLELVGGAETEAREAEVLDRAENDLKVLLDELIGLLPPGRDGRNAAVEFLDAVLLRLTDDWMSHSGRSEWAVN